MKNYFNYHLKRGFPSELIESWSNYLGEEPKKVQFLIHLIICIISVALLLKLRKKNAAYSSSPLIDSLQSASLKVVKVDLGLQKLNEQQWDTLELLSNTEKMDQLFDGRFHSVVDYLGAYTGAKSMTIHQLFNMLWPKVFFGVSLFMGSMSYKKNPNFRLKKELSFFVAKLPANLNWIYIFGTSIKTEYSKFTKMFWLCFCCLLILTLSYLVI